jgi:hypothetical protein
VVRTAGSSAAQALLLGVPPADRREAPYRERHVEWAICKGCGKPFERSAVDGKSREFHSLACQYRSRSVSYRGRADVLANIARARKGRAA